MTKADNHCSNTRRSRLSTRALTACFKKRQQAVNNGVNFTEPASVGLWDRSYGAGKSSRGAQRRS